MGEMDAQNYVSSATCPTVSWQRTGPTPGVAIVVWRPGIAQLVTVGVVAVAGFSAFGSATSVYSRQSIGCAALSADRTLSATTLPP